MKDDDLARNYHRSGSRSRSSRIRKARRKGLWIFFATMVVLVAAVGAGLALLADSESASVAPARGAAADAGERKKAAVGARPASRPPWRNTISSASRLACARLCELPSRPYPFQSQLKFALDGTKRLATPARWFVSLMMKELTGWLFTAAHGPPLTQALPTGITFSG